MTASPQESVFLRLTRDGRRAAGALSPQQQVAKGVSVPQACLVPWWGMICPIHPHSTCLSASSAFLVCAHDSDSSQLHPRQCAVTAAGRMDTPSRSGLQHH